MYIAQLLSANDDTYTYDSRGNITSKTVGNTVTNFTYANTGWKDLLVSVDDTELEYDANGNVILYGDREFTWTYGRSLSSVLDGMNEYTYTYDENGIRTSKTVDDVTTYYNTKDGVILSQTDGENTWYFQYDTSGTPLGFVLNGTQYFYITNQMNDVLAITDTNGDIVGNYEYDAWGKVLTADTDLAKQNPLRYRGYYYDNETGYYYLQSRYYDSNICRFINADIAEISILYKNIPVGTNLLAYCNNDPVNNVDYKGLARLYYNGPKFIGYEVKKALKKYLNDNYTGYIEVYRSSFIVSKVKYTQIIIIARGKVIKSLIRDSSTLIALISIYCDAYIVSIVGLILAFLPYRTDNIFDNSKYRLSILLQNKKIFRFYRYKLHSVNIRKVR